MGCAYIDSLVVKCIFVWSVTIFRATDGSSITWYEPPPSETVTDPAITSTTHKNMTKGFLNEKMSCSFNLTSDMSLVAVSFELGLSTLAGYLQSQSSVNSLDSRFNATWVPTKLTLIVFNVTGDNKGEYLCRVQFFSGGLKSWLRKIVVDVLVQPQITNISGKIVTEGGIVTLKCSAEGNPAPSITWIRLLDDSTVTMPLANIRRQDAGNYKCIADNGVGSSDTGVTFIDVQYPVEATGSGGNTTVLEGGAKNFTCPVDGNPEPNIKWYKGVELSGDPISDEKQLEARETGCYTCVARNSLSPSSVSITQCLIVNTSRELPTTITYSTNAPISEGPPWTVIGFVVGAAVILVIAAGAVTWWMRKKKCNEDAKHGDLRYEEVDHLDTGDNLVRKASGEDQ